MGKIGVRRHPGYQRPWEASRLSTRIGVDRVTGVLREVLSRDRPGLRAHEASPKLRYTAARALTARVSSTVLLGMVLSSIRLTT